MKNENDYFPTSDFPLATFLFAKGIILQSIKDRPNDYRRKVFVFNEPPPELLSSFQSGTAEVNVIALANAQNTLRAMLRGD